MESMAINSYAIRLTLDTPIDFAVGPHLTFGKLLTFISKGAT